MKSQLEAKGKSTEGVETFEEFYGLLQSEAVMLQKKYQPQLRKGIKIAVDLVNSVKQDEKDGDVDVKVRIAPNATITVTSIDFKSGINEEETEKNNKDFIEAAHLIVNEAYETWAHKNSKFEGKEVASNEVNNFFLLIIKEIEQYKSVNMDGFIGIESILDGTGVKRKIKISRDTEFIGNVIANYEKVKKQKNKPEPLLDQGVVVPNDFVETKDFGLQHGQNVYKKGSKYYSRDIGQKDGAAHNGGVWKVFKSNRNRLKRIGTADKDLNIFKK